MWCMSRHLAALLIALLVLVVPAVAAQYPVSHEKLASEYRTNEKLRIVATILNNDSSAALDLKYFNVTIRRWVERGRTPPPAYFEQKNLTGIRLLPQQAYTVCVEIDLSRFTPGEYNLTAYFVVRKVGEHRDRTIYIWRERKIIIRPAVELTPEIMLLITVLVALIVGYVLWMIFRR